MMVCPSTIGGRIRADVFLTTLVRWTADVGSATMDAPLPAGLRRSEEGPARVAAVNGATLNDGDWSLGRSGVDLRTNW